MILLLVSLATLLCGGAAAAALARWPRGASWAGALSAVMASTLGLISAARTLFYASTTQVEFGWHIPAGKLVIGSDPLTAFFLVPVFGLGGIAAFYGREYLLAYRGQKSLGAPWLAYNLLLASLVMVLAARQAILFLAAWEVMSLASYVLIVFEHERSEARRAGWTYLIATHLGTALLIAMFLVLESEAGSFVLRPATFSTTGRAFILLLAFAGFGVKAGLIPFHVWLPEAHAAAPSHVSALMSGVVIKMGIYGLLRTMLLVVTPPAWFGEFLIVVGLSSALYGISMASTQRDLKRVLAYSSIENMGLVALGLGLAFWGFGSGRPILASFGLWGALLHVWNHTAMKGLLFLGAGGVVHATGTKDLERLGGLMKRAPITSASIVLGALAISGLPPLNGLLSEWLLYRSLLDAVVRSAPAAAVVSMLALGGLSTVGALTALCFVRVCSVALLGESRTPEAASAHETPLSMTAALIVLSAVCLLLPVAPRVALWAVAPVATQLAPELRDSTRLVAAALTPVGHIELAILVSLLLAAWLGVRAYGRTADPSGPTWGCGYAAPTPRMQYTARSFGQLLADLVPVQLRPSVRARRPEGLFPTTSEFATVTDDPFIQRIYEPAILRAGYRMARLRWLQQGAVHVYLLYILIALAAGLAWASFAGTGVG